jgi:chromatin segregation and condensation protein Rec8/ScpA/Scc1 (kleisin family)
MRSVADCVQIILARFALADEIEFTALFEPETTRGDVIVTFLALLELVRLRVIRARQDERFGAITLGLAVASLDEAIERSRDMTQFESWRGGEATHEHADG